MGGWRFGSPFPFLPFDLAERPFQPGPELRQAGQFGRDVFKFFDPQEVEAMAKDIGFVERRSPVNGLRFLLTFTTGLLNTPDGTLAQLAAFLGAI